MDEAPFREFRGEELWAAWQERLVKMRARDLGRYPQDREDIARIAMGAELWFEGLVNLRRFKGTKFETQARADVRRGRRMVHDGSRALNQKHWDRSGEPVTKEELRERIEEAVEATESGDFITSEQHDELMARRFPDLVDKTLRNIGAYKETVDAILAGEDLGADPEIGPGVRGSSPRVVLPSVSAPPRGVEGPFLPLFTVYGGPECIRVLALDAGLLREATPSQYIYVWRLHPPGEHRSSFYGARLTWDGCITPWSERHPAWAFAFHRDDLFQLGPEESWCSQCRRATCPFCRPEHMPWCPQAGRMGP